MTTRSILLDYVKNGLGERNLAQGLTGHYSFELQPLGSTTFTVRNRRRHCRRIPATAKRLTLKAGRWYWMMYDFDTGELRARLVCRKGE